MRVHHRVRSVHMAEWLVGLHPLVVGSCQGEGFLHAGHRPLSVRVRREQHSRSANSCQTGRQSGSEMPM